MSLSYFDYIKKEPEIQPGGMDIFVEEQDLVDEEKYIKNKDNVYSYIDFANQETTPKVDIVAKPEPSNQVQFSYFDYIEKNKPQQDEIAFAREMAYGMAQEPTALGSLWRISKAGVQSLFNPNESYEEARARIEQSRQEKIFEEFPEFKGREETAGVMSGRVALALADPITFLFPWVKIAKAGKVASVAAAGAFGATDLALREEALYGEVRPEVVALGFGFGVGGGIIGEVGMGLYRRAVSDKITTTSTKTGEKIIKDVKIPGEKKYTPSNPIENATFEKLNRGAAKEASDSIDNIGSLHLQLNDLQKRKQDLSNIHSKTKAKLEQLAYDLPEDLVDQLDSFFMTQRINMGWRGGDDLFVDHLKKVVRVNPKKDANVWRFKDGKMDPKLKTGSYRYLKTTSKAFQVNKNITDINKKLKTIDKRINGIYEKASEEYLNIWEKRVLGALKNNSLTENFIRGVTQEVVRPLFGGLIGAGVGASLTPEDGDNSTMITLAVIGATMGKFIKTMQSKPFELIPQKTKNAAGEEFFTGVRRSYWNVMKSMSGGSHMGDLAGYSDDVYINFGLNMYTPYGSTIVTRGGKRISAAQFNPAENEALNFRAFFNHKMNDMFANHNEEFIKLAGRIANRNATKNDSFLLKGDINNPKFKEAEKLSQKITNFYDEVGDYARARGIDWEREDGYGGLQMLSARVVGEQDPKINIKTMKRLTEAYKIQHKNILKSLPKADRSLSPKKLAEKYPFDRGVQSLFNKVTVDGKIQYTRIKPETAAKGHIEASRGFRRNSLFDEGDDLLFKTAEFGEETTRALKSTNSDFVLQAAKHFDNRRTLFDPKARASVSDLFINNPRHQMKMVIESTVPVAEFVKKFGAKGEGIKKIFKDIDDRYVAIAKSFDRMNKNIGVTYKNAGEAYLAYPKLKQAANAEKKQIKRSLEAYFGVYNIKQTPSSDSARLLASFLQMGLATTRLARVAIPSMGDWVQTISNSGIKASIRSLAANLKGYSTGVHPLSGEGLGFKNALIKSEKKGLTKYWDMYIGKNRADAIVERELSDVMLLQSYLPGRRWENRMNNFTKHYFEAIQLGRVTRIARNFAYDAGVFRVMDIASLFRRSKKSELFKTQAAITREVKEELGLSLVDVKYLSQYKNLAETLADPKAVKLLKKAGMRAANRDAIVPLVGNRRLFTQSKNPWVKFLGSFLSWSQGKTAQANALVSRVEEGDMALFLKMSAAIPVLMAVRELQVSLSTSPEYKKSVREESWREKFGEGLAFSGLNTWGLEKARSMWKYQGYGTSFTEQLAPVLGYMEDLLEIPVPLGEALLSPDDEDELFKSFLENPIAETVLEVMDVLPVAKEAAGITRMITEDDDDDEAKQVYTLSTGGLVSGPDVPQTKENPAERINPYTKKPYVEKSPEEKQMEILGFNK